MGFFRRLKPTRVDSPRAPSLPAAAVPWAAVLGVAWVLWGPGSGAGSPGLAGLLGGPGGSRRVQGGGLLPGASRCSGPEDGVALVLLGSRGAEPRGGWGQGRLRFWAEGAGGVGGGRSGGAARTPGSGWAGALSGIAGVVVPGGGAAGLRAGLGLEQACSGGDCSAHVVNACPTPARATWPRPRWAPLGPVCPQPPPVAPQVGVHRHHPVRAPLRRAGHARGPERAHLLPLPSGVLRGDDRLRQPGRERGPGWAAGGWH